MGQKHRDGCESRAVSLNAKEMAVLMTMGVDDVYVYLLMREQLTGTEFPQGIPLVWLSRRIEKCAVFMNDNVCHVFGDLTLAKAQREGIDVAKLFRKAFDRLAAGGLLELGKLENSMLALFAFPLAKGIT